jgi:hypothetical protein
MSTNGRALEQCQMPSAFSELSPLLPGEDPKYYEFVKQMIIDDLAPQNNIEWLWALDLIELSWEILRYRRLKQKVLDMYREVAIQSILQRLDGEGMPIEASCKVIMQTKRNAEQWRNDRDAAAEIEARLARHGFDVFSVTAEVFVQAQSLFDMFNSLMQSAQSRRLTLLREINIRREFGRRVKSPRSFGASVT